MKVRFHFSVREPYVGSRFDAITRTFFVMVLPCLGFRIELDPLPDDDLEPVVSPYEDSFKASSDKWREVFKEELDRMTLAGKLDCNVKYGPRGAVALKSAITDLLNAHEKQAIMLDEITTCSSIEEVRT